MRYYEFKLTETDLSGKDNAKYFPVVNQFLQQGKELQIGKKDPLQIFKPDPNQVIKSRDDVIKGTIDGEPVEIKAVHIHKSPEIKALFTGQDPKKSLGNKGNVAEGILGAATFTRLIKRPGVDITVQDVFKTINELPETNQGHLIKDVKEVEVDITDWFELKIRLHKESYANLKNTELLLEKMPKEIGSIVAYVNDALKRYGDWFEKNARPDSIKIISDGVSDEKGTKTDVQMIYKDANGKRVVKHFDLSVKTGTTQQIGQVGYGGAKKSEEEKFEILRVMFSRFGIDVSAAKQPFLKSESTMEGYGLVYTFANELFKEKLIGEDSEKEFLKKFVDGIKYFATLNDERIKLVQFTQKGFYVLDFKRLNDLYNLEKLDLDSQYKTGVSADKTVIPSIQIYDKKSGSKLLGIRVYRSRGYIRNLIEKGPLLVQLTKARGSI